MPDFQTPPRLDVCASTNQIRPPRLETGDMLATRWYIHRGLPASEMSVVYFCYDTKTGLPLVAKSLPSQYFTDASIQRFIAECETWISLGRHKNIATAHFVEIVNDFPFIFVEWVKGKTAYNAALSAWIGTSRLDTAIAMHVASQVCEGMQYAYNVKAEQEEAFVHRDIKPANILVTSRWEVKVTDFGIAAARALNPPVPDTPNAQQVEKRVGNQSLFLGTPAYMSPEHFLAAECVDQRSDIYSLGCVIYEMIAGQLPFMAGTYAEWERCQKSCTPPKLSDVAMVPDDISSLVASCLAKDPELRPKSFAEVKEWISQLRTHLLL